MGVAINNVKTLNRAAAVTLLIGVVALSVASGAPSLTVVAGLLVFSLLRAPANGSAVVGLVAVSTQPATRADNLSVVPAHLGRAAFSGAGSKCSRGPEQSVIPAATTLGDSAVTLSSKGVAARYRGYPEQRFG